MLLEANNTASVQFHLPRTEHRELRVYAAQRGESMSTILRDHVRLLLANQRQRRTETRSPTNER